MDIELKGVGPDRYSAVQGAIKALWPAEDWIHTGELSSAWGESSLCGGESEEEFTDRLAEAIWRANEKYCQVTVTATLLENLPSEMHIRGDDDYAQWQKKETGDGPK
jgi:hypothetical protein